MPVVQTIKEKCKHCYACVRTCSAKAIRIFEGQAEVIADRCVGCGNCVRVCSQKAKKIQSGIEVVELMLHSSSSVYAIIAPSFPAAFPNLKPGQVVSALVQLGFSKVMEVAIGADLIAQEYQKLAKLDVMPTIISTPCPALVEYIQKYRPELLIFLAPIVSPMIATGRLIKQQIDSEAKVVFIGPCIAKKKEKVDPRVAGTIDEVLTFVEITKMLQAHQIDIDSLVETTFDGPSPYIGRIFPVSGGLLRTASLSDDVLDNDIIVTEGPSRTVELIDKLVEGTVEAKFLDILFCEGCINGPQMSNDLSVFQRKNIVANYVRERIRIDTAESSRQRLQDYAGINLRREFTNENIVLPKPTEEEIKKILARTNKFIPEDELNCNACGYPTCRDKAIAVSQQLAEVEMCFPYLVHRLQKMNQELIETQEHLVRTARLASMGEMATGVAHEINNPLAGVLVYIKLMLKKLQQKKVPQDDLFKFNKYLDTMEAEISRCSEIVKNLLEFARPSEPVRTLVSVPELVQKSLFLVKHQIGLLNIEINQLYYDDLPEIKVDMKQIQQVLLNLFINSAQAMPDGGELTITGRADGNDFIILEVTDTGCGIPKENLSRIFDPFFSTKLDSKGTGLGLSVAFTIIQNHGGNINVRSEVGVGTSFTIKLPRNFQN